jgi:phosphoglycolate phosphatase-like HAD superfamily hydrolase
MPSDVAAARNSGLAVAVVSTGSSTLEQLQAARADHYLARFSDLLSVVRNGADA